MKIFSSECMLVLLTPCPSQFIRAFGWALGYMLRGQALIFKGSKRETETQALDWIPEWWAGLEHPTQAGVAVPKEKPLLRFQRIGRGS